MPAFASARKQRDAGAPALDNVLQTMLQGMRERNENLYGSSPPSAQLSVTIVAATNLSTTPSWVAVVAGAQAETGAPNPYALASHEAPRGSPSWADEPLELPVHDITSDLALLLVDHGKCVGRIIVPLVDLLPSNPFWHSSTEVQLWCDIFPPSPAYTAGEVHELLSPAVAGVDSTGMQPPASGVASRALVRIELALERGVLSAYLFTPPFALPSYPPVALGNESELRAEELLLTVARVAEVIEGARCPAAFRLATVRPWSIGGALLALLGWLLFVCSPTMLPWWLLSCALLNGYSKRAVAIAIGPPPVWEAPSGAAPLTSPLEHDPSSRRRRLDAAVALLMSVANHTAAAVERLANASAASDVRASCLALVPLLMMTALLSAVLAGAWAAVQALGGAASATFLAGAIWAVANAASFHKQELIAWLGARPYAEAGGAAARLGSITSGSSVVRFAAGLDGAHPPPSWMSSEHRSAAMDAVYRCGGGCSDGLRLIAANLWQRLPDAPTENHRAIARAAMQLVVDAHKGGLAA